ncbi:MAG: branched-chain amino acid ABC transporter permease [Armatimonadota bacterium]|nr:MAG: branched-chain amino acid ABC transporter permease [Armatimonadota bacterium]
MDLARILRFAAVITLLLALQALFASGLVNPYYVRVLILCCFSVMLAVSLNIIIGHAGQFSIGHAGFYAVGAYSAGAFTVYAGPPIGQALGLDRLPVWLEGTAFLMGAVCVGTVFAALAGLAVGLPSLRLRGDYLAIATLGFGEMIRVVIQNVEAVGGPRGFSGIPIYSSFFWAALFAVTTVWIARNLARSRHGRALLAIREDETAASVLGINVTKHKVAAFVLSSALAGCAGALYAHYEGYLEPRSFDFIRSIEIIIMVVIGGMGSTTGAVIAAVILTLVPELLRGLAEYRMVIYSALLILFMLVRPQGLFGTWELSWETLRARWEKRRERP